MEKGRHHETLICPTCKRATVGYVIDRQPAHENATVRIPARIVLQCARSDCKTPWYVIDKESESHADTNGEEDRTP